jgi:polyhydroxyalkanoate synthesis regulator phasin
MESKSVVDRLMEMGLGLAAYSEEKVSLFLKDIAARGETKKEDVEKFRAELKAKGASFRKEFSARIEKEVESALKKMNLATAREVAEIRAENAELKRKIAKLEKSADQ